MWRVYIYGIDEVTVYGSLLSHVPTVDGVYTCPTRCAVRERGCSL